MYSRCQSEVMLPSSVGVVWTACLWVALWQQWVHTLWEMFAIRATSETDGPSFGCGEFPGSQETRAEVDQVWTETLSLPVLTCTGQTAPGWVSDVLLFFCQSWCVGVVTLTHLWSIYCQYLYVFLRLSCSLILIWIFMLSYRGVPLARP